MDKALKEFITNICREQSRSLVGKSCKQIEVLQAQTSISNETKEVLNLQKALIKELIYEEFRTFRNSIIFYTEGREYQKLPIYTPNKDTKSV
jgi:hypothetical protein